MFRGLISGPALGVCSTPLPPKFLDARKILGEKALNPQTSDQPKCQVWGAPWTPWIRPLLKPSSYCSWLDLTLSRACWAAPWYQAGSGFAPFLVSVELAGGA